jgi:hypothetical protein
MAVMTPPEKGILSGYRIEIASFSRTFPFAPDECESLGTAGFVEPERSVPAGIR